MWAPVKIYQWFVANYSNLTRMDCTMHTDKITDNVTILGQV